jgi:hypothetical protein
MPRYVMLHIAILGRHALEREDWRESLRHRILKLCARERWQPIVGTVPLSPVQHVRAS